MTYTNENRDAIVVFAGHVARELLRRGYTIIDVKADRTNKIKSVFVFRRENNIEKVLHEIAYKELAE
ncbi:hypothetical protein [Anaerosporobacter sp.]